MKDLANNIKQIAADKTDIIHQMAANFNELYSDYADILVKNWILVSMLGILAISTLLQVILFNKEKNYWKKKHLGFKESIRNEVRKYKSCF